jgi:hypothetical protein
VLCDRIQTRFGRTLGTRFIERLRDRCGADLDVVLSCGVRAGPIVRDNVELTEAR